MTLFLGFHKAPQQFTGLSPDVEVYLAAADPSIDPGALVWSAVDNLQNGKTAKPGTYHVEVAGVVILIGRHDAERKPEHKMTSIHGFKPNGEAVSFRLSEWPTVDFASFGHFNAPSVAEPWHVHVALDGKDDPLTIVNVYRPSPDGDETGTGPKGKSRAKPQLKKGRKPTRRKDG